MSYPVEPTQFKEYFFKPEWYERDFFHSPDGIKEFPQHHCKLTYMLSKPYINKTRTAIDIGCRDGEYTRYLQNDFHHVFCFDVRYRRLFAYNADPNKTTHFRCALGNTENKYPREDEFFQNYKEQIYTLDSFNLSNVDYIKIDTDGFEYDIIQGALKTIEKNKPIIICEAAPDEAQRFQNQHHAIGFLVKECYYSIVEICDRNIDRVLVPND